jgi:hypothetical protein
MTIIDTNVSNYTLSELLDIAGLEEDDDINYDTIKSKTDILIKKFKKTDPKLSIFMQDIQYELLNYAKDIEEKFNEEDTTNKIIVEGFGNINNSAIYPSGEKEISNWYNNEYLTQNDENQNNKITQRKQKIEIFGNQQVPMNRQQIATTDTFNVPLDISVSDSYTYDSVK